MMDQTLALLRIGQRHLVAGAVTAALAASVIAAFAAPASAATETLSPNDLLVSEVNYDNASTDYYEYIEVTNTTAHPIDFAADGVTLRYGTSTPAKTILTFHTDGTTVAGSPTTDPVIPAHGTQIFWAVNTATGNDAYWQKTDADFRTFYGLASTVPIIQAFGQNGLANTGNRWYEVFQNTTQLSSGYVPATNPTYSGNYAAHFQVPADRSNPAAVSWYNGNTVGKQYVTPGTVDLEQLGYTRAIKIATVDKADQSVTLHNTSAATVDLSGYVLQSKAGKTYTLPAGTTIAAGADATITWSGSDFTLTAADWVALLAPRGYAYSDGFGIVDTTGPFLHSVPYDANSGQAPPTDPTTGLPLPPAGGLYRPAGISALSDTVYVSNTGDNVLAAVANGTNMPIAGDLSRSSFDPSQDGGPAANASLYQPGGSAVDADGNVYLADSGDNVVLKITKADGTIHLVAGTGTAGGPGAVITGTSTSKTVNLYRPESVAVAADGDLYIADTYDNRIVKVAPDGAASLVAGAGKPGYTGDGHAATAALLNQPAGVAVDSKGNVYIADSANNVIRRVDARRGDITTVAGDYAFDAAHNGCLGGYDGDGGPATAALLNDPQGVAVDGAGNLFIADTFNNAIRQVTPDGTISTIVNVSAVAGSEGTSPTGSGSVPENTHLNTPYAVTVDATTNALYLADTKNSAIAQVLNVAEAGHAAAAREPHDQIKVTGSGTAFAACQAMFMPPVVTGVSPSSGPRTGGTTVTITGSHFTGTTAVMFGTAAGTDVTVLDDTHLKVTTPNHDAGQVNVTVTNAAGTSGVTSAGTFTFLPVAPIVTSVYPVIGPTTGGTTVTIAGSHFSDTTGVKFGTVAATKVVVVNDSLLRVTSPAHAAGRVDVTVTNADGDSTSRAENKFTYLPVLPSVSTIAPSSGSTAGGTTVTITGRHLGGTSKVNFGAAVGTKVTVVDDSHLTVTSPAHAAGTVVVTVTTFGGTSIGFSNNRFTFTKAA